MVLRLLALVLAISIAVCDGRSLHTRQLTHGNAHNHAHAQIHARQAAGAPRVRRRARCAPRENVNVTLPVDVPALPLSQSVSSVLNGPSSAIPKSSGLITSRIPSSTSLPLAEPTRPSGSSSSRCNGLLPIPGFSKSWSTCPEAPSARELSDSTLRPGDVLRSTMYSYTDAPDGRRSIKAHFPQGSFTFKNFPQGGFSFYAPGPADVDLTTAKEATFGYNIYFPQGFAFNRGGKLPGFYGGNSLGQAVGCSGGRRDTACFSVRLMWRTDGAGEFYTYLPPGFDANNKLCDVPPFSECNPTYGASVGRGIFRFATGAWTPVAERVRLNDPGQSNGEIELFVNGRSVLEVKGLILRDSGAGRIRGIQAQTFFGGSTSAWASPKDQDIYFSDFSVAITQNL